jgi:hypothetical protein
MDISMQTQEKFKRIILNSHPFLFGILEKRNKKGRMIELQEMGFLKSYTPGSNPNYSRFYEDLIKEIGIQGIIEKIIIKKLRARFTPDVLDYLRRCWYLGQSPAFEDVKKFGLFNKHPFVNEANTTGIGDFRVEGHRERAFVFMEINTQFDFVESWTPFAEFWFEEIEPLIGDTGSK